MFRGARAPSPALASAALIGLVLLAGLMLGPMPAAHADNMLVASDPSQGSIVPEAPTTVSLRFMEPLDASTTITVKDPNAATISRETKLDGSLATVTIDASASPQGRYRVNYRVSSFDNHPVAGSVIFTVGTAVSDSGGASTDAGTTAESQPAPGSGSTPGWAWPAAAVLTLLVVAVAIVATRRERQRRAG